MHTKPMDDSEGRFDKWAATTRGCPKCDGLVLFRRWESNCGGYVDHQYQCQICGHFWWVDGPDS